MSPAKDSALQDLRVPLEAPTKESEDLSNLCPRKVLMATFSLFGTGGMKRLGKEPSAAQGFAQPSSSRILGCAGDLSCRTCGDCHQLLHPGAALIWEIHLPYA